MSEFTRDRNFDRAQARYNAMEPPYVDDDREPDTCGHCTNEAHGEWSDDEEDEDGFQPGSFTAFEECGACGHGLCLACADGDQDLPCPALGRPAYPFERAGMTLQAWRENMVQIWRRNAERGYCTKEHADARIADIMANYGPTGQEAKP